MGDYRKKYYEQSAFWDKNYLEIPEEKERIEETIKAIPPDTHSVLDVGFVSTIYYDAKVNQKDFQIILGTTKGWLPYYYMGIDTFISGMNNWAPEVITAMLQSTFEGDLKKSEKLYLLD